MNTSGFRLSPEASERNLALVTAEGEVIPLVEKHPRDARSAKDKRLREMDVEVLLRRHHKQPHGAGASTLRTSGRQAIRSRLLVRRLCDSDVRNGTMCLLSG